MFITKLQQKGKSPKGVAQYNTVLKNFIILLTYIHKAVVPLNSKGNLA